MYNLNKKSEVYEFPNNNNFNDHVYNFLKNKVERNLTVTLDCRSLV